MVASAFYQRANFYSAAVHLAQSSLSLMVRPSPPFPAPLMVSDLDLTIGDRVS